MNIPDINRLRTEGFIEEAYSECLALLTQYPTDREIRVTMARCLKSLAEEAARRRDYNRFVDLLQQLAALRLDEIGEPSFANRFSWDVRVLFDMLKTYPDQLTWTADCLTNIFPSLTFICPHKYYSHLAETFLTVKGRKGAVWTRFTEFMDWFGFENLMPEDYEPVELRNDRTLPSLSERLHTAYFKALMTQIQRKQANPETIEHFLNHLGTLTETGAGYFYTLYHQASILMAIGRREDAVNALLPFARKNRNSYWVWDLLADALDDDEMKLACYCRALICAANPKFLGRVHLKTASVMHRLGYDGNARAELNELHQIYRGYGWKMPYDAMVMSQEEWFINAVPTESNLRFYHDRARKSDELIFTDTHEIPVIIMSHNEQKQLCTFATADRVKGFFFTRGLNCRFLVNRIYFLRIDGEIQEQRVSNVISCRRVTDTTPHLDSFYRSIDGTLRVIEGRDFGFVDDIFVDLRRNQHDLRHGDRVCGTAAISYNHKNQTWGWSAASLRPQGVE